MKLALVLVLSVACISLAQPTDFLSEVRLDQYTDKLSLLNSLNSIKTSTMDQQMELNILTDFIKQKFQETDTDYETVLERVKEAFEGYREKWTDNMVVKTMEAIGLDLSNLSLVKKIKQNPKAYSINYQTFKILTFKNNES